MPSRVWSRDDIRNILLAIYAARFPTGVEADAGEEVRLYRWGCRAAIQSLLLACGLPLQLLDQAGQHPAADAGGPAATRQWLVEDLESIIAAIYRSAVSTPVYGPEAIDLQPYHRGFGEVIAAFLEAIGSRQQTHRWQEQVQADRYWVFTSVTGESAPRTIGAEEQDLAGRLLPEPDP